MNFCLCTPHKYGCSMLLCLFFLHIVHMLYFKVEIHVSMEKLCYSSFMNGEVVAGCSFYVRQKHWTTELIGKRLEPSGNLCCFNDYVSHSEHLKGQLLLIDLVI